MSLYVYVKDENHRSDMREFHKSRRLTDSGFDLLSLPQTLEMPIYNKYALGCEVKTGIHFAALDGENPVPYLLIARSSTSLTPLRMSNQIGLADAGYRGELIARVDCFTPADTYEIPRNRRLFQVCQYNFLPWKEIVFVDNLEDLPTAPDNRGEGGFGSTGR
jgi:dUTP pyrophosphatase